MQPEPSSGRLFTSLARNNIVILVCVDIIIMIGRSTKNHAHRGPKLVRAESFLSAHVQSAKRPDENATPLLDLRDPGRCRAGSRSRRGAARYAIYRYAIDTRSIPYPARGPPNPRRAHKPFDHVTSTCTY